MSTLEYQMKHTEIRIDNPTIEQIEECIDAMDNWDRSGVRVTIGKQFLLITGGTKENLVALILFAKNTSPLRLVDSQLYYRDSDAFSMFCLQYQSSEMPIKYTIPKSLAHKAVQELFHMGRFSHVLLWLDHETNRLFHGDELDDPS